MGWLIFVQMQLNSRMQRWKRKECGSAQPPLRMPHLLTPFGFPIPPPPLLKFRQMMKSEKHSKDYRTNRLWYPGTKTMMPKMILTVLLIWEPFSSTPHLGAQELLSLAIKRMRESFVWWKCKSIAKRNAEEQKSNQGRIGLSRVDQCKVEQNRERYCRAD